jgi:hypothetical protein
MRQINLFDPADQLVLMRQINRLIPRINPFDAQIDLSDLADQLV